jgi:hypothetical protein
MHKTNDSKCFKIVQMNKFQFGIFYHRSITKIFNLENIKDAKPAQIGIKMAYLFKI